MYPQECEGIALARCECAAAAGREMGADRGFSNAALDLLPTVSAGLFGDA